MQQLNWFEADIKCWDGVGMPCDITDLPVKIRQQIASAIIKGHMCGSFSEYIDSSRLSELDPEFVVDLLDVAKMQKDAVAQKTARGKDE